MKSRLLIALATGIALAGACTTFGGSDNSGPSGPADASSAPDGAGPDGLDGSTTATDASSPIDSGVVVGSDAALGLCTGAEHWLCDTFDRDGAIKLLDAAVSAGVTRYVIVSSVGAESPPDGDDVFSVYLRAKAEADAAVVQSDRDWTVVRPGALTDDPATGAVRIHAAPIRAEVTRHDVAAVLAAVLHEPRSARLTIYVVGGDDPIEEALEALLP